MSGEVCEHGSLARVCGYCERDAEIAQLRKALVWATRNGVQFFDRSIGFDWHCDERGEYVFRHEEPHDGTDQSLIETLCKLAEGE